MTIQSEAGRKLLVIVPHPKVSLLVKLITYSEKGKPYVPVKSVLAVVFMWQGINDKRLLAQWSKCMLPRQICM